ncbi:MAG: hypothetical protein ABWW65_01285 [Thermoprotei archaeon]
MLREFSYLLTSSRKSREHGMLLRILIPLTVLALLVYTRLTTTNPVVETGILVLLLAYTLLVSSYFKGFRSVVSGLKLVLLFTVLGALIFLVSTLTGLPGPKPVDIVVGAVRLVVFFLVFSLFFQLLAVSEIRSFFNKLGLRTLSQLFSMVFMQLPLVFYYLSESSITIRLKYRGKRLYRIAIPLVLLIVHTSQSLIESYMLYGYSNINTTTKWFEKKDLLLYTELVVLTLLILYLVKTL